MIKRTTTRIIRFMKYFHYAKDHNNSKNLLVYSQQVFFECISYFDNISLCDFCDF